MSDARTLGGIGLLVTAALMLAGKASAGSGGRLSASEVASFARSIIRLPNMNVLDGERMIVRIASIESAFDPGAVRVEPNGDASTGLMQTLVSTARWLHDDLGYRAFGRPGFTSLTSPQESIYFGAAYLTWLRTWNNRTRAEQWIVRAYNGGPGGADIPATEIYWRRYLDAKAEFG